MPNNIGYLVSKTDKESDEYYTPRYAVIPLLKYIPKNVKTIWCPFDTEFSQYVQVFQENGYNVIYSHIDDGCNFFYYEPEERYDCIISNPPFSLKDDVLKRLFELDKSYAILLPLPSLQGQNRFEYLRGGAQALIFDKRVNFYLNLEQTKLKTNVPFASIYICKDFLPKDLIFEHLLDERE